MVYMFFEVMNARSGKGEIGLATSQDGFQWRIDSAATGTTLIDFLRATNLARILDEIVGLYDGGSTANGDLIVQPEIPDIRSR